MKIPVSGRDTATISSKGQVTIPKHLRDQLKLHAGSKLRMVALHNGRIALVPRTGTAADIIGFLHDPDRAPLSVEEMEDAIADNWAFSGERGTRSRAGSQTTPES
ncbi:MAG: AbrB/MazE/SpoVT family DNA-binding domain-containing protein [Actinobacteria bacterium]|nr:AbrB/MazE/SpoVT family DNA-binding domain-containing protein [Actinomycetota bacterium]